MDILKGERIRMIKRPREKIGNLKEAGDSGLLI